jgi:putative membrane protein
MKYGMILASCLALAIPAYAQTGTQSPSKNDQTGPSAATRQFVEKVAISDMFEIQSNKLALDKSKDDAIQQFARKMVDDHTKTSNELKLMAKGIPGLQVPAEMDAPHRQKLEKLQSADGRQFYQLYRAQQIEAHQAAVKLFTDYAKNGNAPELTSWAQKTLPALQQHLQHAQALPQNPAQVGQAPAGDAARDQQAQRPPRQQVGQKVAQPLASASPNHIMGSDLRGTTVYGANNENIGEIDDIVLERDGNIAAVIVGVGGFLGIGEKKVAIPFPALEIQEQGRANMATTDAKRSDRNRTTGEAGTVQPDRIVLRGMTKKDLEDAPNFKTSGR